jgi:DNA-binding LacI/PurR family transcriptional regulator
LGIGGIEAARRRQLRVPQELARAGVGAAEACQLGRQRNTIFARQIDVAGFDLKPIRKAVKMLLDSLNQLSK